MSGLTAVGDATGGLVDLATTTGAQVAQQGSKVAETAGVATGNKEATKTAIETEWKSTQILQMEMQALVTKLSSFSDMIKSFGALIKSISEKV